ncbi:hypothetical protein ALC62_01943, partial [Cyphomyrmex costatus]
NLSSIQIPNEVQFLLQLGDNFSLPFNNFQNIAIELIKNIENNVKKLQTSVHNTIRNRSWNIVSRCISFKYKKSFPFSTLKDLTFATKKFVRNNPNVIFTKADKGNITVALDKKDYLDKVNVTLQDTLSNRFIKVHKDGLSKEQKRNVVYKIKCKDCDAFYVGQTSRKLKTRIKEHKNNLHSTSGTFSVVSGHRLHHSHDFDWDDTQILDVESSYNRRIISENIHIKLQKNGLNIQNECDSLNHTYNDILDKL